MKHAFSYSLLICSIMLPFVQAQQELITSLTVQGSSMRCTINPEIKNAYLTDDFFVEYEEDIPLESMKYEIVTMPVVLNLFSLVWFSGKNYYVDSMDSDVFESLEKLKQMFKFLYPECPWSGSIIPRKLVYLAPAFLDIRTESSCRAMLFSGGLDSNSSFFEHFNEDLLLITAWGQFDLPLADKEGWAGRKQAIEEFAKKYGKKNAFFRSNYSEIFNWDVVNYLYPTICNWRISTVEELSWAGLVAPILITKKCPTLYVPSGGNWFYNIVDMRNPYIEEMVRFAGFGMITDQFDLTRFDKAKFIAETCKKNSLDRPFIKVCHLPNTNCGSCRKCCMTMISLLALGENITEYGFKCSNEIAVDNSLVYLSKKMGYFNAWNFRDMQPKIRKIVQDYPERKQVLEPFISFDLNTVEVNDRKFAVKVKWEDLQKYAPYVRVPRNLSQEQLDINV